MTKAVLFKKVRRITGSRIFGYFKDFVTGFLLAGCGVSSACPFGIAYAAVSKRGLACRFAGVLSGYFLTGERNGVLYAAATMICLSCHMVLRNIKAYKNRLFMPVCASALLIFCKSAVLFGNFSAVSFLLLLCEAVLCFGSSLLFDAAQGRDEGAFANAGRALMLVAAVAAFEPFRILGWFSAARISACAAVMIFSRGGASGAGYGICLGALLDLCGGGEPGLCLVYGVGGLVSGALRNVPKIVRAGAFCAGCIAVALWSRTLESIAAVSAECVFTAAAFCLVPEKLLLRTKGGAFVKNPDSSEGIFLAVKKLGHEIVKGRHPSAKTPGRLVSDAADSVCRECKNASVCWEKNGIFTANAFSEIENTLQRDRHMEISELPHDFSVRCIKRELLCDKINGLFAENRHREQMHKKEKETELLMKRQYEGVAEVLRELAEPSLLRLRAGSVSSAKIAEVIRVYFPGCEWDAFFRADRFMIDVYIGKAEAKNGGTAAAKSLSQALGFRLSPPSRINTKKGEALRFCKGECFCAETAVATRCKEGETVCGDSVRRFCTEDGRAVVLISDGMGTGKQASEMSSSATDMLSELVMAGASLKSALCAVLPVLEARFSRSGFVTLDMLEIDLFSGTATFIKCGAPASYIVKNGKKEEIFAHSLPAGLDNEPVIFRATLQAGDTVVMMTDGVEAHGPFTGTPSLICQNLIRQEAHDDMTAVALTVTEA